jgi:DMSO/TMAO reductase YedYZ molybdopterin-dependent catalytic subunit
MRHRTWRGVVWFAAGLAWVVGLLAVAPLVGRSPLTPAIAWAVRASPGPLATFAIETFGKAAQPLLGAGVVAVLAAGLAAAGAAWPAVHERLPWKPSPVAARKSGLLILAVAGGALSLAAGGGFVGAVAAAAAAVPSALVLSAGDRTGRPGRTDLARRSAIRRAGFGVAGVAGLGVGARAIRNLGLGGGDPTLGRAGQPLDGAENGSDGGANAVAEKRDTGRTITSTAAATASGTVTETESAPEDATAAAETATTGSGGGDDPFGFDFGEMPARVGSIDDHYVVDINSDDPLVDTDGWTLDVTGHVDAPYALDYEALLDHEGAVTRPVTMVCISNVVGGGLIGTTTWRGVPLAGLLEAAGVREGAVDVVTRAADGYSEAIPLSVAREKRVMIAFGADGVTLTPSHGFPARLLIPGRYGMKSTKWVEEIEVVTDEYDAYWERRGWDEEAVVNTLSYVRSVHRQGERTAVGGVAFAGIRGIDRVEVSTDGGDTWTDAELEAPPGEYAWRRWRHVFERDVGRSDEVVVRATDGEANLQTREESGPHPGGSTGWHHREM